MASNAQTASSKMFCAGLPSTSPPTGVRPPIRWLTFSTRFGKLDGTT